MFNTLHQIDWKSLKVAEYSSAEHIPDAIQGFISTDPEIRRRSYGDLDNVVVRQSDLYEAAWYVVPFLLEIIADPSTIEVRKEAYSLLYEIGSGYALPAEQIHLPDGSSECLTDACRKAVIEGLAFYLAEIANPSSPLPVRREAVELIFSYPIVFLSLKDRFKALLKQEPASEFRSFVQEALDESERSEYSDGIEDIGSLSRIVLTLANEKDPNSIWSIPEASRIIFKL